MKQLPIRWKIMILSYAVVIFSLLIGGLVIAVNIQQTEERELRLRSMNTARTVAELSDIKSAINQPEGWKEINPVVEEIRTINEADYIVVMNMAKIRYSHPVPDMLGTISEGTDEEPSFAEHTYFSKAKGELGTVIRAFVPIKDSELNQTGVVVVGNRIPSVLDIMSGLSKEILFIVVVTLLFGLLGSILLANHIKKQMFQLDRLKSNGCTKSGRRRSIR